VLEQMLVLGPLMAPLWVGGILWLLFSRAAQAFRFLGVTYLLYLPLMMIGTMIKDSVPAAHGDPIRVSR
jgi:hypothetical protein